MSFNFFDKIFSNDIALWIESAVYFIFIFAIGLFCKKYIIQSVKLILAKFNIIPQKNIVNLLGNYIVFLSFLISLYIAFLKTPITNKNVIVSKFFFPVFAFSILFLVSSIVTKFLKKSISEKIVVNITKFFIIFVGAVLILNQMGVRLAPILTALGIGSLAVALALQDTLTNFFAGIYVLASKQVERGDYVKLDSGQEGTIIEINWRTTLIKELSDAVIVIPNNKLSSAIFTSYHFHKSKEVSVSINCAVAYGSDLEFVEKTAVKAALEIINKCDDAVQSFTPIVRFNEFADSSINFTLYFKVKDIISKNFIRHEIFKNIYKKFAEAKIEIPFPQRVVTIDNKGK